MNVRAALALALTLLLALALTGCSHARAKRVFLFGDSLVFQATPSWKTLMQQHGGYAIEASSLPGTATCDWFTNIARARDQFHPDVVAMSFSGNALGPCMKHADGSPLTDAEYVAKYTADTRAAIATFPRKTTIYLVGAPVNGAGDDRVWQIYRKLAPEYPNTHFVDGGKYLTPGHKFALTLPCLTGEPCTGPVVNGVRTNVVRSPDHAHLCPTTPGPGSRCTGYASGAYRFALVIAQAIEHRAQ